MKTKKHLAQHFLIDHNIALKIVDALIFNDQYKKIDCLEIGPGKGVLTKFLLKINSLNLKLVEFDKEAVDFLINKFPIIKEKIIHKDILKINFSDYFNKSNLFIIGNLPYNITGPIFFKILDNKNIVQQMVAMIQKEVADRIVSAPGNKVYGILSVLLQTFYKVEHLFNVDQTVFEPQPKVKSAVIRLTKLKKQPKINDWPTYKNIVKAAFNQRRKMLRNALALYDKSKIPEKFQTKRAEQLSTNDFLNIYNNITKKQTN